MTANREVRRYYLTRDSENDKLSSEVGVWHIRPTRMRQGGHTLWIPTSTEAGYLGEHKLEDMKKWFRTVPDTDLECIVIEQYAHEQKPAKTKPQKAKAARP